ncbi:MAG: hypothetical protein K9N11_08320 [Lentisphaeria bacterium]|nr:hypothetical protein [Candidatus Neomarinimicrobiota bacterium]MCF7842840.1 hypothetical protein [Lentisphaeria bacterium]
MSNFFQSLTPPRLLTIATILSLFTALISFKPQQFTKDILLIFVFYYLILLIATLLATFAKDRLSQYTVAISQMGYIFLGFSLAFISLLQLLQQSFQALITGFFLTGLPGLALIWAGIQLFRPTRRKRVE